MALELEDAVKKLSKGENMKLLITALLAFSWNAHAGNSWTLATCLDAKRFIEIAEEPTEGNPDLSVQKTAEDAMVEHIIRAVYCPKNPESDCVSAIKAKIDLECGSSRAS